MMSQNTALYELRQAQALTQKEMAKKLDVSLSYYTKVEKGFKPYSHSLLQKVKQAFPSADMNEFY